MRLGLLPRGMRSATSTTFDFGANHPVYTIPAYDLPVYASQDGLPRTTQDSVQDCWLGSILAAIAGGTSSLSFSRRNPHGTQRADFPHWALQR